MLESSLQDDKQQREERLMKELLNDLFEYRNGELIRKVSGRGGTKSRVGDSVGCLHPNGRVQVMIEGKSYKRSRLIWIWHHGDIPAGVCVDHIDNAGLKSDDRIENLRLATKAQNAYNRKAKGCTLHQGKWKAQIQHQGKKIHLGMFNCQTAAHFEYLRAKKKYAGEFAPHVT